MKKLPYGRVLASAVNCFLLISLFSVTSHAVAQSLWQFETQQPLSDHYNHGQLSLASKRSFPELVPAYQGTGIRTDGYSTYLSLKLPASQSGYKTVKGYFALETYPTDTAAFIALGAGSGEFISAAVDRFGQVMIGTHINGEATYYGSGMIAPKFKWLKVNLIIDGRRINLLVNDKNYKTIVLPESGPIPMLDSLVLGRDWRMKRVNIFPVTYINGIIDEVYYSDKKSAPELSAQKTNHSDPVLAVSGRRFADDFSRPKYHLLPAANWTNETHGLLFYKGLYHVFNQKNGANLFLGQINWGHFTSPDLIHWTEQKPALTPQAGYDQNGIWSGCAVIDKGKPVIIYTAGGDNSFGMALAYPTDQRLNVWQKYIGNPVITAVPDGFERKDFHDPYVFRENGSWYMVVGFGIKENSVEKGTLLLYKSTDLKKWSYLHPLFTGDPVNDDSGVFWEMPVFWKMNDKYVLLVNKVPVRGKPAVALYWTGNFTAEKFTPDDPKPKRLEVINRLLSPSVALDASGNTTAIAIIPDETSARETFERGWTHLYSMPRIWKLEDGKINQSPHPALNLLRGQKTQVSGRLIDTSSTLLLSKGHQQLEISADIIPGKVRRFGFNVAKNPDGSEYSRIYFDLEKQQLIVDQTHSSLKKYVPLQIRSGTYRLDPAKKVNLHLYIDGSVVEGFIDGKDAFTTRIFPFSELSNQVELFAEGGAMELVSATTWLVKNSNNQTAF